MRSEKMFSFGKCRDVRRPHVHHSEACKRHRRQNDHGSHHRDTENTENGYATAESNRIRGGRECDSGLSSVNSVSLWFNVVPFSLQIWLRLRRAMSLW